MSCDRCSQDAVMYIRFNELELCDFCYYNNITPEEENKMDELKVYTGKETLQAWLDGKTLSKDGSLYRLSKAGTLEVDMNSTNEWEYSRLYVSNLLKWEFTEVAVPKVGDWVRVYTHDETYTGKITRIENSKMYADWEGQGDDLYLDNSTHGWEILTPEQVSEYKREQAFVKLGRKLNEFRSGDIVYVDHEGVIGIVVSKSNSSEIKVNECNRVQGWSTKPHQLTPISFIDQQVDLS